MNLVRTLIACSLALIAGAMIARSQPIANNGNVVLVPEGSTTGDIVRAAANVVPSGRQLAWQQLEFTAFIHFTVNTFTDREWGLGTESEQVFNPRALDARQWAKVCKQAGMKMIILTAKHHDGFCLWPSKYTEHSVKNSPWHKGQGDVVRELSDACREFGLKFGIYLSPWDRHEKTYGDSPVYNQHFENQLTELLTNYGSIAEVWFDGANGEGPNGKRQVYDWQAYYRIIRTLQPQAVIAIMGPDVRWVGTESGYGRETEWSVIPDSVAVTFPGAMEPPLEQGDAIFRPRDLMSSDLGSRSKLAQAKTLRWYPAEVDVSIRPGWFYHASEDRFVKSPAKLVDIYYSSVGRNAVLLLNIPPDEIGFIHENDVQALKEMRRILNATFRTNVLSGAKIRVSNEQQLHNAQCLVDGNPQTYWSTDEDTTSSVMELNLADERSFNVASLKEFIQRGQRVESFAIDAWVQTNWKVIAEGTTIGYQRLLRFPLVSTSKVRLRITQSRSSPQLSEFGLYRQPPMVTIGPHGAAFLKNRVIQLSADAKDAKIRYSLDGKDPDLSSPLYTGPLTIQSTCQVKALAYLDERTVGLTDYAEFRKARYAVNLGSVYSQQYTAGGALGLADGLKGGKDHSDPAWQGYEGNDLSAVVDLGAVKRIKSVNVGFLQDIDSWIFFPEFVQYSFSENGIEYRHTVKESTDVPTDKAGALIREFRAEVPDVRARFVKIVAKNIGVCPSGHAGAGKKAWIFVDEITVD